MTRSLFSLLLVALLAAAVPAKTATLHLQIWNGTTGATATADEVDVMTMGKSVQFLANKSNVTGHMTVPNIDLSVPHLVQVTYKGVQYSHPLMPGVVPSDPFKVDVYEVTHDATLIHSSQLHVFFGHDEDGRHVAMSTTLVNSTSLTYVSNGPTLTFSVPAAATHTLKATINRGTVPINLAPKSLGHGLWGVQFNVEPGRTTFLVQYDGGKYTGSAQLPINFPFHSQDVLLITEPTDMKVSGPPMRDFGIDKQNQVRLHGVDANLPGKMLFTFVGGTEDLGQPRPTPSDWSHARGFILGGCVLLVLFAFFLLELMRGKEVGGAFNLSSAECEAMRDELIGELADLEGRHTREEVSDSMYRDERRRLRLQLSLLLSGEESQGGAA